MGKIICVGSQKGGVGKTSLASNLAVSLILEGKTVLMVDLDYIGILTRCFGYEPMDFNSSIATVLENPNMVGQCIYETDIEKLSIIPSSSMISSVDIELAKKKDKMERLRVALEKVRPLFDYIIIDTNPTLSVSTLNALISSDYLIIPAETKASCAFVLDNFISAVETIKTCSNEKLEILGVVATMYNCQANEDKDILGKLQDEYELLGIIRRTTVVSSAMDKGKPCVLTNKRSVASQEYREIAKKIIEKVEVK